MRDVGAAWLRVSDDNVSSNEHTDAVKMLDKHVNELSEHFENVHIFVTRHEGEKDQTRCVNRGSGNWFARYGQIREWLVYEDQKIRECAKRSESQEK